MRPAAHRGRGRRLGERPIAQEENRVDFLILDKPAREKHRLAEAAVRRLLSRLKAAGLVGPAVDLPPVPAAKGLTSAAFAGRTTLRHHLRVGAGPNAIIVRTQWYASGRGRGLVRARVTAAAVNLYTGTRALEPGWRVAVQTVTRDTGKTLPPPNADIRLRNVHSWDDAVLLDAQASALVPAAFRALRAVRPAVVGRFLCGDRAAADAVAAAARRLKLSSNVLAHLDRLRAELAAAEIAHA